MSLCRSTEGHKLVLAVKPSKSEHLSYQRPWRTNSAGVPSRPRSRTARGRPTRSGRKLPISRGAERSTKARLKNPIVISDVQAHLSKKGLMVTHKLVGMDYAEERINGKLGVVYRHGRAAELYGEEICEGTITGIPGIGNTTLAKVIFNNINISQIEKFPSTCGVPVISLAICPG